MEARAFRVTVVERWETQCRDMRGEVSGRAQPQGLEGEVCIGAWFGPVRVLSGRGNLEDGEHTHYVLEVHVSIGWASP